MDNNFNNQGQAPQQNQYGTPSGQPQSQGSQDMTVGQWLLTIFLTALPCFIGLIISIVWAVSSNTPQPKKNFAIAMIIWNVVIPIILGLLYLILGASFASSLYNLSSSMY
jgi:hypothetical protein